MSRLAALQGLPGNPSAAQRTNHQADGHRFGTKAPGIPARHVTPMSLGRRSTDVALYLHVLTVYLSYCISVFVIYLFLYLFSHVC